MHLQFSSFALSDIHPKKAGILVSYRKAMIQVSQMPSAAAQILTESKNHQIKESFYQIHSIYSYLMYKKDPTLKHA